MTEQIFALYSILFKDLNSERKALVLVDAHYDIFDRVRSRHVKTWTDCDSI